LAGDDRGPALGPEARAGAFVLAGIAAAVALVFYVGEIAVRGDPGLTLSARFRSAELVAPGAPVTFAGVRVGRVEAVNLVERRAADEGGVELVLSVRPDVPVRRDSRVTISRPLVGEPHVEIGPGGVGSERVRGGERLAGEEAPTFTDVARDLQRVAGRAEAALVELEPAFRATGDIAGSATRVARELEATLAEARALLAKVDVAVDEGTGAIREARAAVAEVRPSIEGAARSLERSLARLDATLEREDVPVHEAVAAARAALEEARALLARVEGVVRTNEVEVLRVLLNLDRATANLADFSRKLEERPSVLIFDDETDAPPAEARRRARRDGRLLETGRVGPLGDE